MPAQTRWLSLTLILFGTSSTLAQLGSGPKPGAKVEALTAFVVTGDRAGEVLNMVAERGTKPTVYLFVQAQHWDRPMARFIKTIDQRLEEGIDGGKVAATVAVWLTDDADKSKAYLPIAQESLKLTRTTLAVFEGDPTGPVEWDLDAGARLTAVVVRDCKAVVVKKYQSVNEKDTAEVVAALKATP